MNSINLSLMRGHETQAGHIRNLLWYVLTAATIAANTGDRIERDEMLFIFGWIKHANSGAFARWSNDGPAQKSCARPTNAT